MGIVNKFLGVGFIHLPDGIFLDQSEYATQILTESGMIDCKPLPMGFFTHVTSPLPSLVTPMETGQHVARQEDPLEAIVSLSLA